MNRFVVIVLDGFGIGAMEDVPEVRPQDAGACTLGSLLKSHPDLYLPNLERLGLMNALGRESACMRFSPSAVWGRASLMHWGADTFWGHQEIMGTLPRRPVEAPFSSVIEDVADALRGAAHRVEYRSLAGCVGDHEKSILLVDEFITIADNLEADPGQNYNVMGALDAVSFGRVLSVGRTVRALVRVARVICFGNPSVGIDRMLAAMQEKGECVGISSPRSGVYGDGYLCIHMGYGVDPSEQVPFLLAERGVPVLLFGKVADIVENPQGRSVSWIDTDEVMCMTFGAFEALGRGFICTNVQETDLAGHREDTKDFISCLETADVWIGRLMERMDPEDILLVMADHGNDPAVGHSHHTREKVPLLLHTPQLKGVKLGDRKTLADVGATVAACFGAGKLPNPEARPLEALKRFWKR